MPLTAVADAISRRREADYLGALEAARQATESLRQDSHTEVVVRVLVTLSRAEEDLGHYDDAIAAAERALDAAGDDPVFRARASIRRAGALLAGGRTSEVIPLSTEVLELVVSSGASAADHVEALVALGLARLDVSHYEQAAELVARAVAVADESEDEEARARAMMARLSLVRYVGRYEEADALVDMARRAAGTAFGPRSLEVASVLNDFGVCCKFSGRFGDGEAAYRECLVILESVVGPAHPDAATVHHNLGGLAHASRDFAAALPSAQRAVDVRTAALGPDHLLVADDQIALAGVLLDLDRGPEAEQLLRAALASYERARGPVHYEIGVILGTLGSAAQRRGGLDEADALHRRALRVKESVLGPNHPEVAITLNNLGVVARRQGRDDEATDFYRRAITVLSASVDDDHPTLLAVRRNLARMEGDI